MKRFLRIIIKTIGFPFVILLYMGSIIFAGVLIFFEWLFENTDEYYPATEFYSDATEEFKLFFKNWLR